MALQLEEDKALILRLVQQKMDRIAPNLSLAVRAPQGPRPRCCRCSGSLRFPAALLCPAALSCAAVAAPAAACTLHVLHQAELCTTCQTALACRHACRRAQVGTEIAAQLMGVAGGLVSLSKMPACNVQVRARMHRWGAGWLAWKQRGDAQDWARHWPTRMGWPFQGLQCWQADPSTPHPPPSTPSPHRTPTPPAGAGRQAQEPGGLQLHHRAAAPGLHLRIRECACPAVAAWAVLA